MRDADVEFELDFSGDPPGAGPPAVDAGRPGSASRLLPVLGWGGVAFLLAAVGVGLVPDRVEPADYLVADLSRPPEHVWDEPEPDPRFSGYGVFLASEAVVTLGPDGLAAFDLASGAERWRVVDDVESCGFGARDLVACVVGPALGSTDRDVLTVDVTSGESLRRDGEHVVAVETLGIPEANIVEVRVDRAGTATVESRDPVGDPRWSVRIPRPRDLPASVWVQPGLVLVHSRDLLALDAHDGSWLDPARVQIGNAGTVWAAPRGGGGVDVRAPDGTMLGELPRGALLPRIDSAPGTPPYFVLDARGVAAVDDVGTPLWRDAAPRASVMRISDVAVLVDASGRLDAVDARDGRPLWSHAANPGWTIRWTDGRIVAATAPSMHGSRLAALEPRTGRDLWSLDLEGGWVSEISPAGYVLVQGAEGFSIWRLP